MPRIPAVATILLAGFAMMIAAMPAVADEPLAAYRWHSRVILVSAPGAADPALRRQRALVAAMGAGARERDIVLVEAVGDAPAALRLRAAFGIDPGAFTALLIGKDGGEKLRSATPLDREQIFPFIDAMPMRRDEMRCARTAAGGVRC